ncbi:DUF6252 family protein [Williamwhitmania taraxaci]|uniref:DUF6252 family protein n=1 Tax=Williamwhitmania taraxaci TaxID=1640674 RepID=UPI00373FE3AA
MLPNYCYNTDSLNGGIVTITLIDSIKNIISGTFYFTAMNEYSKVVIEVSNGRFDLNKQ